MGLHFNYYRLIVMVSLTISFLCCFLRGLSVFQHYISNLMPQIVTFCYRYKLIIILKSSLLFYFYITDEKNARLFRFFAVSSSLLMCLGIVCRSSILLYNTFPMEKYCLFLFALNGVFRGFYYLGHLLAGTVLFKELLEELGRKFLNFRPSGTIFPPTNETNGNSESGNRSDNSQNDHNNQKNRREHFWKRGSEAATMLGVGLTTAMFIYGIIEKNNAHEAALAMLKTAKEKYEAASAAEKQAAALIIEHKVLEGQLAEQRHKSALELAEQKNQLLEAKNKYNEELIDSYKYNEAKYDALLKTTQQLLAEQKKNNKT